LIFFVIIFHDKYDVFTTFFSNLYHQKESDTYQLETTNKNTDGVDGAVSKRYNEWLKMQKYELVTDSESE